VRGDQIRLLKSGSRSWIAPQKIRVMSSPENPPTIRGSWLDRWFASPWRTLLTWVVLASVGEAFWDLSFNRYYVALEQLALWLRIALPEIAVPLAMGFHGVMISSWFVPFALRLSPWRTLAWFGVEIGSAMAWLFFIQFFDKDYWQFYYLVQPAALAAVLYDWRSRPWMCLVSGGLVWLAWELSGRKPGILKGWEWTAVLAFLFAAPLLFGTRLLRPEEGRRSSDLCMTNSETVTN
jgi:hypothetical protein